MEGLFGPKLLRGSSEELETNASLKSAVIAIYFSAHWCGPCQAFTPELRKVYERCKKQGKSFEIVFVSSDKDEASFKQYFATMPWLAVPYADRTRQQTLSSVFNVRGIPGVVLVSSTGALLDASGRSKVMSPGFPSTLPREIDLADFGPLPTAPVPVVVRHKGVEHEIEVDPEEDWEILRMQIFSVTEVPAEQQRLFGLGVEVGPLSEATSLPQALARGLHAQRNSGKALAGTLADVPAEARKASSSVNDDAPGGCWHRGRLGDDMAWAGKKDDRALWYQMDLGFVRKAVGVAVLPRQNGKGFVSKFKVSYAEAEAGPWTFIGSGEGAAFDGPTNFMTLPVRAMFPETVASRFVRIHPLSFTEMPALRADVILADEEQSPKADRPPVIVVLSNFCAGDPFEVSGEDAAAAKDPNAALMEEQHLAMLQCKLAAAPPRLQNQMGSFQHVLKYEDLALQRHALDQIPVCGMDGNATTELKLGFQQPESYELAFMRQLLRWFKYDFFTWTNAPSCEQCGSGDTKTVGATQANQLEQSYGAGTVEVAKCNTCGGQTRFPRYNDPAKLLETRTGRCGEWANCFTLICRAVGYEARHVHDWTDHVWTEIFSDSLERWVHLDSCEAAMDTPLVYEQGWGKKLTYCIAFGRDNVRDVTRRYSRKFSEVLTRRTQCSEQQLTQVCSAIDEFASERGCSKLQGESATNRRTLLAHRSEEESKQLTEGAQTEVKAEEQVGRTSGDKSWRESRGELGSGNAREQALACSEQGVHAVGGASSGAGAVPGSWVGSAENYSFKEGVLTADLRRRDGSMNKGVKLAVVAGCAYGNNDGAFEVDTNALVTVPAVNDSQNSDGWKRVCTLACRATVASLKIGADWKDQGFGNRKGRVRVVLRRPAVADSGDIHVADCFGLCGAGPERERGEYEAMEKTFGSEEPIVALAKPGDLYVFEYTVGGGGGHALFLKSFGAATVPVNRVPPVPAGVASPPPSSSQPETAAGGGACATPPAKPVEKAPEVCSKEATQALVKAAFTELVAAGVPPNEALAKAIAQVKQRAAANFAGRVAANSEST